MISHSTKNHSEYFLFCLDLVCGRNRGEGSQNQTMCRIIHSLSQPGLKGIEKGKIVLLGLPAYPFNSRVRTIPETGGMSLTLVPQPFWYQNPSQLSVMVSQGSTESPGDNILCKIHPPLTVQLACLWQLLLNHDSSSSWGLGEP